jgi:hypothetical protein
VAGRISFGKHPVDALGDDLSAANNDAPERSTRLLDDGGLTSKFNGSSHEVMMVAHEVARAMDAMTMVVGSEWGVRTSQAAMVCGTLERVWRRPCNGLHRELNDLSHRNP